MDQDKVLAYRAAEATVCSMCGTREEEWVDENGRPLDPQPLTPVGVTCHGCAHTDKYTQSTWPKGLPPGKRVRMYPSQHVDPHGRIRINWASNPLPDPPKPTGE